MFTAISLHFADMYTYKDKQQTKLKRYSFKEEYDVFQRRTNTDSMVKYTKPN